MTDPAATIEREIGILAGRLSAYLSQALPPSVLGGSLAFLDAAYEGVAEGRPLEEWGGAALDRIADGPVGRLVRGLSLSSEEVDLVLLAGLPDEHEGFADLFRSLHPARSPHATAGLAAQLFCRSREDRRAFRSTLLCGPATESGLLELGPEGAFFEKSLQLADSIWPVFSGVDAWPSDLRPATSPVVTHGLGGWLDSEPVRRARRLLRQGREDCTILVTAEDAEAAFERAGAMLAEEGVRSVRLLLPAERSKGLLQRIQLHALARGTVPLLLLGGGTPEVPEFPSFSAPVVVAGTTGSLRLSGRRAICEVPCPRMGAEDRRRMWRAVLPTLTRHADHLASRYPLEPYFAELVAKDLALDPQAEDAGPGEVGSRVRARAGSSVASGVKLIRPSATWDHLVLPPRRLAQLREAVDRLRLQGRVLDDWEFLAGRPGARGVRMLFSGPPGTGKTLSAEVIATALEADALLVVDLSRVVSKWLGETEKNLAEVFNTAERSRAILLIDEADALLGKRTEISDAHDRYANLETAYLLARLESFEGLAILSTNLRQNIDTAFVRRLEFQIDFDEPNASERESLWRIHVPGKAPVSENVDLAELAAYFPIVGGLIRNAAVAAGFLAAADGGLITRKHFIHAIRREYEKSGKAFPGLPHGISEE